MFFRKATAFIKRDFLNQTSYKLSLILDWAIILMRLIIFYFIAKLLKEETGTYFRDYGGEYFHFVLIGIIFSGCLLKAMNEFSINIRQEQMMGTLEAILTTPTKLSVIIISMGLWSFIYASINIFVYLLCGVLFFGTNFSHVNLIGMLTIFILTVISFSSIGTILASFIVIFKRGDSINWFIDIPFVLLGGVYFPVSIMPKGLQIVSHLLPITYSLRSLRHTLLQGYSLKLLLPDIIILLIFCTILFPLSILIFKYAVRKAKIEGTLAHY